MKPDARVGDQFRTVRGSVTNGVARRDSIHRQMRAKADELKVPELDQVLRAFSSERRARLLELSY